MSRDLKKLIKDSLEKAKSDGRLKAMIQDSIKNLAESGVSFEDMVVSGLAKSFARLPAKVGEIIESHTGKVPQSGRWTSEAVMAGFNSLSVKIRGRVIEKLADEGDPTAREWGMYMFIKNFDKFPNDVRERILIKFSGDLDVNVKGGVLLVVVMKFSNLQKNVRELIGKFARDGDPEMRAIFAHAIAWKFNELSPYGKLLNDLSKDNDESVRRAVAFAVARNFQNLNDETRGILAILAEDESVYVRKGVANAVVENRGIKEFPIYREIFGKLNKDEKMRKYLEELASAYSS